MEKYVNLNTVEVNEALFNACKDNDIEGVSFLLENYPSCDFSYKDNVTEDNCITILFKNHCVDIIKYLIQEKNKKDLFTTSNYKNSEKQFTIDVMWNLGKYPNIELLNYILLAYKKDLTLKGIKESLGMCLRAASYTGHIDLVKYLLLSKNLPVHPNLSENNYYYYQMAAEGGHLDIVKFYLLSPELKKRPKVRNYNDNAVRFAAWRNHLPVVEYLLTSKELPEHADIHATGESVLNAAIRNENIEMLKFLLTSPLLKEHSDIHYKNDLMFRTALKENKVLSLQYLICDYEIALNDNIKKAIKKRIDIQKMFEMRSLYKKLNNKLIEKQTKTKTEKI